VIPALRAFGPSLQDLTSCTLIQLSTMTVLNIRKNTANIMRIAASAVENAKVPTMVHASEKLSEYRIRIAALMMPNDIAFVITPKNNI